MHTQQSYSAHQNELGTINYFRNKLQKVLDMHYAYVCQFCTLCQKQTVIHLRGCLVEKFCFSVRIKTRNMRWHNGKPPACAMQENDSYKSLERQRWMCEYAHRIVYTQSWWRPPQVGWVATNSALVEKLFIVMQTSTIEFHLISFVTVRKRVKKFIISHHHAK